MKRARPDPAVGAVTILGVGALIAMSSVVVTLWWIKHRVFGS